MHVATTDLDCRLPRDDQRPRSSSSTKTAVGGRKEPLLGPIPVQRSSKTRRVTYLADHSRRFLALSLRNIDVNFWKKAAYASYPLRTGPSLAS